ncbi:MAG: hypothetical protein ABMA25_01635 [Ilumatobacteraceae bacterium]
MSSVDVSIEVEADGRCVVKLQSSTWELNVRASAAEFMRLATIRQADWNSRMSLTVGESMGAPAFWSSDGQAATVAIGTDDETWDAAFTVPVGVVDEIVRLATSHA